MNALRNPIFLVAIFLISGFDQIKAQKNITIFDTLYYQGKIYELGATNFEEQGLDPKKQSYDVLRITMLRAGWDVCPSDSINLEKIMEKVPLTLHQHHSAIIAIPPKYENLSRGDIWFRLPLVHQEFPYITRHFDMIVCGTMSPPDYVSGPLCTENTNSSCTGNCSWVFMRLKK